MMGSSSVALSVDALLVVLIGLSALAMVVSRQMLALLRLFVVQSVLLGASAVALAVAAPGKHLYFFAVVTIVSKAIVIPLLLRSTASREIYATREVDQVLSIPTALLLSAVLALLAWTLARPLTAAAGGGIVGLHIAVGVTVLLFGAFAIAVRREAVAQLLGLLVMENGAFLAGIALVPDMAAIVEVAVAVDVPVVALVLGLLIRTIHEETGTTAVGRLTDLKEG
jgi:hydrogenase-4 component E